jgi:hypothetical protein
LDEQELHPSNWSEISKLSKEAEKLNIPRKTHEEILSDLRAFREER